MAKPYSGPKLADIRSCLGKLVTEGLVPYNVADVGGELLKLQLVTRGLALADDASEDEEDEAYAGVLTEVLRKAAKDPIIRRKDRKVLKHVLPLKEELLGTSIKERRAAAGKDMKDGKKGVKAGTVRTYYEPRALDRLASVLVRMEAESRGESPPGEDEDAE